MAETELLPCPLCHSEMVEWLHQRADVTDWVPMWRHHDRMAGLCCLYPIRIFSDDIPSWNRRSLPLPDPAEGSSGAGAPPFDKAAETPAASRDALTEVAKAIYETIWDERWDATAVNSAERHLYRQAADAGLKKAQDFAREMKAARAANMPATHRYVPHAKYPWFCAACGYPENESLKHDGAAT